MLNATQRAILVTGGVVAALMALFPPFFDTGGLFGGVQFAFVLRPPAPNYQIDFRPAVAGETLLLQLSAAACFTLAAMLAHDDCRNRRAFWAFHLTALVAAVFAAGFVAFSAVIPGRGWTGAPFLWCLIPVQFPGGYFLFWLRLAALALIAVLAALIASHRSASTVQNGIVVAVTAATLALVCLAAAKAALR